MSDSKSLHCSFCKRSQHDTLKLVCGPGIHICYECVELNAQITHPETAFGKFYDRLSLSRENPDNYEDEYDKKRINFFKENLEHILIEENKEKEAIRKYFQERHSV